MKETPQTTIAAGGDAPLAHRRVVLGVTGGIAAYKAAELVRLYVKAGATVRVVMTEAATRFITPLTLQTLSGAAVALDLFDPASEAEIGHIRLADEADIVVVAPATADFIARMAAGMANDLLAAVVLATRAPILLAPAMNVNMWTNPLTQQNLARLLAPAPGTAAAGRVTTVGPRPGAAGVRLDRVGSAHRAPATSSPRRLACWVRAPRPAARTCRGDTWWSPPGGTREAVDAVRFLGNRSSGKMGAAMAAAAAARGAEVTLVAGPGTPEVPTARRIDVESAADLEQALADLAPASDVVVMAAAVADFRPHAPLPGKMSRRDAGGGAVSLALEPVPDLLAGLARGRSGTRPYLVGFAAETVAGDALAARAGAKLREKGCDAIVANDVSGQGIGFGAEDNEATLLFADGARFVLPRAGKRLIADQVWNLVAARLPAAEGSRA
jgi:phosphopantothenoylcysteine decarboxylase/phosphopantothenate--cysteine ligase